ncbi:hypothetical protein J2Z83_002781 [Virgibacillus natechei]|uniref:Uncharacterized protein n=1 Tax=Virgibacillus natechei TaxID=1216297 RepID=A0ABS4II57_9BACI|nr:hypothetical protein [Virgibacillus natechei]MBP1970645.1 hypothetical protein [Virgibacillus natechei]UZD13968.1 hypothetical protein OLD84_05375 [Virgibacillus natechei]
MNKRQLYNEIYERREQLDSLYTEFWNSYSGLDTWYFWFLITCIVLPLVFLYFVIDRNRLFEIAFYGYTAHILWLMIDTILTAQNYFVHPHSISHLTPTGISVTAVLFPVTFMLLYQYCTNKGKNFYLYAVMTSIVFAFGYGGISNVVGLLEMHKGMNLAYLFLIDIAIAFIALWATKVFLKIKKTNRKI